ncbi:hypothetical protein Agabi119p4_9214 [Agaricus bisporus var. burnettii]|uniref:Reverse transcriptase Ty1/copia-type domain-containing protein n=1 Tax=Agaricus bisporus var. burnettii TaxID=192524 RepID=A0A8H7C626_AGABI|nr:hypothetical protein Agabi119p4_9214 [Agaricus bisporus var. burnettii]
MYPLDVPSTSSDSNIIAPRPLPITTLHPVPASLTPTSQPAPTVKPSSDGSQDSESESKRDTRPSARMRDSLEYLGRAKVNLASVVLDADTKVPKTFTEAMRRADLWLEPMRRELEMMRGKDVYRLVPRPEGKNVVQSRWVFANKYDDTGAIVSRKACLVAKGFTQVIGEDYDKMYALVARLESVRLVNFVSAFLNSENVFEVFMEQPPGFEEGGVTSYYTSRADPQIRSRVVGDELTLTSTWTDDILGVSSTQAGKVRAKQELEKSYELKDLGTASFILGMKMERDEKTGTVTLSQCAYCERILDRFHMADAKPRSTPLPAGLTLSTDDAPKSLEEMKDMKNIPYREALGSLMWLQVATRPDLSYAVNLLSRFASNPGRAHWNAIKHTIAYLKGTLDYGISYHRDGTLQPFGYVNADYAGDTNTRRSTEGHIFFVAGGPVSWASKRQETVALLTVEAEYMALIRATQQAIWLSKFMREVGLDQEKLINVFADNNGAIANTQNNKNHRRTKHIDVKHHFIKQKVMMGEVTFTYVPSAENLANILTKPLARNAVVRCCRGMGLLPTLLK